jgi:hypothetical protein
VANVERGGQRRAGGGQRRAALGLVALRPPVDLPAKEITLAWHQRYHADGAHRWLRVHVLAAVADLIAG